MLCHSCNPAFRDPFDFAENEARSAELVTQMRNYAFAIPPFIFPFDCQVEARSAELVQAIHFSYTFFLYSPESFCLSDLFLAYHLVTQMRQIYSLFPIYNSAHLGHQNFACF